MTQMISWDKLNSLSQLYIWLVTLKHGSKIEDGQSPTLAAGHSVGEFAALATAGAFSFLDGLQMVSKRGEIMSKIRGGGMAAVIGMDADSIHSTMENTNLDQIDLANFNSPGQIVISGPAIKFLRLCLCLRMPVQEWLFP